MGGTNDPAGQLGDWRNPEFRICAHVGTARAAKLAGEAPGSTHLERKARAGVSCV